MAPFLDLLAAWRRLPLVDRTFSLVIAGLACAAVSTPVWVHRLVPARHEAQFRFVQGATTAVEVGAPWGAHLDPWGRPFRRVELNLIPDYNLPGGLYARYYSVGPDGVEGMGWGQDDIIVLHRAVEPAQPRRLPEHTLVGRTLAWSRVLALAFTALLAATYCTLRRARRRSLGRDLALTALVALPLAGLLGGFAAGFAPSLLPVGVHEALERMAPLPHPFALAVPAAAAAFLAAFAVRSQPPHQPTAVAPATGADAPTES